MIETRQARYFVAVADELHFGRAAEVLQMSQPPLSQAIRALERQIGARLLDRTSRSVALTEAGHAFLRECRVLLANAERAERAAALAQTGVTGSLRLGAVTSAFADPLPAILGTFRRRRPGVTLRVTEIDTHDGRDAVLSGELDVALVRQVPSDRRLESHPLRRDHLVVALPTDHAASADPQRRIDLANLADEDWVWLPRRVSPDYHDELVAACRQYGFSPRATHVAGSITSQLAMVACGLGVTLVPKIVADLHRDGMTYREPTRRLELVELSLLWRADETEPLVHAFVHAATHPRPAP
jgi:DNA-binding transcriptional LysR family regulator